MQDTAPQKTLRDGAYTWRAVQPFGPSTAHRAEVEGGRVSVWQTGEGEGLFTTPAAYLEDASLFAAALGEWKPVPSLAALSEREARTVWAH